MKQSILEGYKQRSVKYFKHTLALLWQRFYRIQYQLTILWVKHKLAITILLLVFLVGLSVYFSSIFQSMVVSYFSNQDRLDDLRTLLVTLGGTLIGVTAISFALIMFAMQINVERMPHELFGKFSTDKQIISVFGIILLLAIGIAGYPCFQILQ
jgi:uncharacterized membrane protein